MAESLNSTLPPEIRVEESLPRGVRYVLPRREQPLIRLLGGCVMLFGTLFAGFALVWIILALGLFKNPPARFDIGNVLFALFGVPFVVAGIVPLGLGLLLRYGHAEIEIDEGELRAVERAGWVRWRRKRPLGALLRFEFRPLLGAAARSRAPSTGPEPAALADHAALCAVFDAPQERHRQMLLAPGYPKRLLTPLAQDLARRCERSLEVGATPALGAMAARVPVLDQTLDESLETPLEQPADSDVQVEEFEGGLTLTVPPPGLKRGGYGLFGFGLVWCGFMAIFTSVMAFADQQQPIPWPAYLLVGAFWCVGLGMLAMAWHGARSRVVLAVVGERLMALKTGPFRTRSAEWTRDELLRIESGPSGVEINDRPVLELQIHPRSGKKFGLLAGRDLVELQWLAGRLRRALEIPRGGAAWDAKVLNDERSLDLPEGSTLRIERHERDLTIEVPPAGFRKGNLGMFLVGTVFDTAATAGLAAAILFGNGLPFPVWIVIGVGFLVGLSMQLAAAAGASRRSALAVTGGRLLVMTTGLFGKREREWARAEVESVGLGPSGWVVNGVALNELQIKGIDGTVFGLLREREDPELLVIAAHLHQALELGPPPA